MLKNKRLLSRGAFTLIELLVVLAIVGVVVVASVVSYKYLEQKKNESKIESDIRQMQLALELYYNKNHSFPGTPGVETELTSDLKLTSLGIISGEQKAAAGEKIYLGSLPESPYEDRPYTYYLQNASSSSYVIRYQIGDTPLYVTEKLLNSYTTTDPGIYIAGLEGGGDEPEPDPSPITECTCPCDTIKDPKCVTCDPKNPDCFACDPKDPKCVVKGAPPKDGGDLVK